MLISVVIATKNRPAAAAAAARSVLGGRYRRFELLIVDQSDDDATREALAGMAADPRVRYLPDRRIGAGRAAARALGIAQCAGEAVALLDDDVEARPDWLARIADEFQLDPALALVCGKVTAPSVEPAPAQIAFDARPRTARWELPLRASGANLSMRRGLFERVGGYQELHAPGERLLAADDADLCYRILRSGAAWRACSWIEVVYARPVPSEAPDAALPRLREYRLGENLGRWVRRGDAMGLGLLALSLARRVARSLRPAGGAAELQLAAALLRGFLFGLLLPFARGYYRGPRLVDRSGVL
jgi:glycosyltransferase involved in cell wall biosynthesis